MFPTTIATGLAFCNRDKQRALLKQFMVAKRHTVIIAPRRYGKTSLINQSLDEAGLAFSIMDLTLCVSAEDLEQLLLDHIGKLLFTLLPKTKQAQQIMLGLFDWLNPEITLSRAGQQVSFKLGHTKKSTPELITNTLKSLDAAAAKRKQTIVLVFDEFQQLAKIKNSNLEAAVRAAMQFSKNITYIFSGSNRHMLQMIFTEKDRPFYNSCEIMRLNKINYADYQAFIRQAFLKKWKKKNDLDEIIDHILNLAECYPYYVNRLCGYFYLLGQWPTKQAIDDYWHEYVDASGVIIKGELFALSGNQRKILKGLLDYPTREPSGRQFCQQLNISEASSRQAVNKLLQLDYVYVDDDGYYEVLDPAMRYYLQQFL